MADVQNIYEEWIQLLNEEKKLKKRKDNLKEIIFENAVGNKIEVDERRFLYVRESEKRSFENGVIKFLKERDLWDEYSKLDVTKLSGNVVKIELEGVEKFMKISKVKSIRVDGT